MNRTKQWPVVERAFLFSCAFIFAATGAAKLISAMGSAPILGVADPILAITNRQLLMLAGTLEVMLCSLIVSSLLGESLKLLLVLWFSTCLVAYRLAFIVIGIKAPCQCLGSLTGMLRLPEKPRSMLLWTIAAYVFGGSVAFLASRAYALVCRGNDGQPVVGKANRT